MNTENATNDNVKYFSVKEACEAIGCSRKTLYKYIQEDQQTFKRWKKFGKSWKIKVSEFDDFITAVTSS